jgi:hypothetical protein
MPQPVRPGWERERDPWADAPVGELSEPLLPRWFVLLAIGAVVAAIAVLVGAFVVFSPEEVPPEARRPPPAAGLTHDVGEYVTGESEPVAYDSPCAVLEGVSLAGTQSDRALLRQALAGLCNTRLAPDADAALAAFAEAGGVVRFAVFSSTGVDSTAETDGEPPRILVNAKFVRLDRPRWIAPVIAHDAVMLAGDPASAETAVRAREVEADVCRLLLGSEEPSRGCDDAEAVLALPDPLAALRSAGYR